MNPISQSTLSTQSFLARSWHWTGPATLEAVREASIGARRFLTESNLPESEIAAWELVVAEAGNNCSIHGAAGADEMDLDLLFTITPAKVIMRLSDSTPGFDWPEHTNLPDDDAEGGRGLYLIDCLTDSRIYARGHRRNILELERSCAQSGEVSEDTDATLMSMTEELSACYESLASIFHFIAEARNASSLEDFADSVLAHLIQSTASRIGILRIVKDGNLETLAYHGCDSCPTLAIENQALATRLDQWVNDALPHLSPHERFSGIVHPLSHEAETLGTLLLLKSDGMQPFNAGEENMIRTFGEFFTQHILSRRHEEQAIRSSIARREFELAAAIQSSLLPPKYQPILGVEATGHCESALSIGGDFYDVIPIPDHGFFFVIADVMGKGVAASMMAAVTRSIIRSCSAYYQHPAKLLELVARQMFDDLDRLEIFVTVAVGCIDASAGVIRIANAGHCPVIVANQRHSIEVGPENPPVGIEPTPCYPQREIPIHADTCLLAYTDGLVDPRNERKSYENEEEVGKWFSQHVSLESPIEALKEELLERLDFSNSSALLADDQTFVLLSCNSNHTQSHG